MKHDITCTIRWIDQTGKPTPDNNQAIGLTYCEEYDHPEYGKYKRTDNYPICAEHAKRLDDRGMKHWRLVRFAE